MVMGERKERRWREGGGGGEKKDRLSIKKGTQGSSLDRTAVACRTRRSDDSHNGKDELGLEPAEQWPANLDDV